MIFSADDPTPSPSPTGVAQDAVQNALDLASLIFGAAVGLVIAFVVALVIVLLTRPIARRSRYLRRLPNVSGPRTTSLRWLGARGLACNSCWSIPLCQIGPMAEWWASSPMFCSLLAF